MGCRRDPYFCTFLKGLKMHRMQARAVTALNQIFDLAFFSLAFLSAAIFCFELHLYDVYFSMGFRLSQLGELFILFYFVNAYFLSLSGAYPTSRLRSFKTMSWFYFKSVYTALTPMMILDALVFPSQHMFVLLTVACTISFFLLLLKERIIREFLRHLRDKGRNLRNLLIVGDDGKSIEKIITEIQKDHYIGLKTVGVLAVKGLHHSHGDAVPCFGKISDLSEVLDMVIVDCVMFLSGSSANEETMKDAIWRCKERGLEVWLKLDTFGSHLSGVVTAESLNDLSFLNFRTGAQNFAALVIKNILDRLISLVLLILLSPVFLVVAILIKATSNGPVFFKQHRVGVNGRRFVIFKFRSMVNNAEQLKEGLRKNNEMKGPVFKMKNDPRMTPLGRLLRKASIDELPQLWNVLRGEMSLVGPRPPLPLEIKHYQGWHRRRLSMKPGITCYWQVEGRNRIGDFDEWSKTKEGQGAAGEWVRLDLKYIDNWSLWVDFSILCKTVLVVLRATGS